MILRSKTQLLSLIVLLIGMLFGAIAANVFADDSLKKMSDNPFENIGDIDDHRFTPPGYSDKLRIYPGH
jgi:hypothetical protein